MKKFFKFGGKGLKRSASETSNQSSSWSLNSGGSKDSAGKVNPNDFKEKDFHKIHKAALNGDLEKLKEYLKKQDVNATDKLRRTALHVACRQGHEEIVRYLLKDASANPNARDKDDATPLIHAIQGRNQIPCEELLKFEADPNMADRHGATPLHYAAAEGLSDTIALLIDVNEDDENLERHVEIDPVDGEGLTPLHYACQRGNDEAAAYLLHENANPNRLDASKRSPLMFACRAGSMAAVKALILHKADPTLKDRANMSAADYAHQARQNECLCFVQTHIKMWKERGYFREEDDEGEEEEEEEKEEEEVDEEEEKIEKGAESEEEAGPVPLSVARGKRFKEGEEFGSDEEEQEVIDKREVISRQKHLTSNIRDTDSIDSRKKRQDDASGDDSWGDDDDDDDDENAAPVSLKRNASSKSPALRKSFDDDDDDDAFGVQRASIRRLRRRPLQEGGKTDNQREISADGETEEEEERDEDGDDHVKRKKSTASVASNKSSDISLGANEGNLKKSKPQIDLSRFISKSDSDEDDDDDIDALLKPGARVAPVSCAATTTTTTYPSFVRGSSTPPTILSKAAASSPTPGESGAATSTTTATDSRQETSSGSISPSKIPIRSPSNASEADRKSGTVAMDSSRPTSARSSVSAASSTTASKIPRLVQNSPVKLAKSDQSVEATRKIKISDSWDDDEDGDADSMADLDESKPVETPMTTAPREPLVDDTKPVGTNVAGGAGIIAESESDWDDSFEDNFAPPPKESTVKRRPSNDINVASAINSPGVAAITDASSAITPPAPASPPGHDSNPAGDAQKKRALLADLGIDSDDLDPEDDIVDDDDDDDEDDYNALIRGGKLLRKPEKTADDKCWDEETNRSGIFDSGVRNENYSSSSKPNHRQASSAVTQVADDHDKWDSDDEEDEEENPTVISSTILQRVEKPLPLPRANAERAKAQRGMRKSSEGGSEEVDDSPPVEGVKMSKSSSQRGYCIWDEEGGIVRDGTLERGGGRGEGQDHRGTGPTNELPTSSTDVDDEETSEVEGGPNCEDALADFLKLEKNFDAEKQQHQPEKQLVSSPTQLPPTPQVTNASPPPLRPDGVTRLNLSDSDDEFDAGVGPSLAGKDDELSLPPVSPISYQSGIPLSRDGSMDGTPIPGRKEEVDFEEDLDDVDPDIPPLVHTSAIAATTINDATPITPTRRQLPKTPPSQLTAANAAKFGSRLSPSTLNSSFGDDDDDDDHDDAEEEAPDVDALSTEQDDDDDQLESKTSAGVSPLSTPVFGGSRAPSASPTRKIGVGTVLKTVKETSGVGLVASGSEIGRCDGEPNVNVKVAPDEIPHGFDDAGDRYSPHVDVSSDDDDDSYPVLASNPLLSSALNPDVAQMYGYNNNNFAISGAGEGNCSHPKNDVSIASNSSRPIPSDPAPILDALHQQTEALAKERGAKEASHSKIKILELQIQALKKQVEELGKAKAALEEQNASLENSLQQYKYRLEEENQLKKNAESLQKTLKDQLNERHNQYGSEMEVKQTLEMNVRDATLQLASAEASLRHVEMERDQLSRELSAERDSRFELEKNVKDLECKLLSVKEEKSDNKCTVMEQLQEASRGKFEAEIKQKHSEQELRLLKEEMERIQAQLEEIRNYSNREAEEHLKNVVEIRDERAKLNAELDRLELEKSAEIKSLTSEIAMLKTKIKDEMKGRDKFERMVKEMNEKNDRQSKDSESMMLMKQEAEQRLKDDAQTRQAMIQEKEREAGHLRQFIKDLERGNKELQAKVSDQTIQIERLERNSSLNNQELGNMKEKYEEKVARLQQEANEAKISFTSECQNLKTQLSSKSDDCQRFKFENDKLGQQLGILEAQAKNFGSVDSKVFDGMAIAKEAYTKGMDSLLARIDAQQSQLTSLIKQNQEAEEAKKQLEWERAELERKWAGSRESEAHLASATGERDKLRDDLNRVTSQLEMTRDKLSATEKHLEEYRARVERTERESLEATSALRDVATKEGETSRTRDQLQVDLAKAIGNLEIQASRYDNLKERFDEAETERKELRGVNRTLAAEKEELAAQVAKNVNKVAALEAELQTINDAYQAEVNSKAVAGLKMAQMTRTTQEKLLESQGWELRIKEATERRKAAEKRVEEEKKMRVDLEEEVTNLKSYLKESRKKQKDLTNERGSFHSMASGFEKERTQYEIAIATMQTNVRQLQDALEHERDTNKAVNDKAAILEREIDHHKNLEKRYKKLLKTKERHDEEGRGGGGPISVPPLRLLQNDHLGLDGVLASSEAFAAARNKENAPTSNILLHATPPKGDAALNLASQQLEHHLQQQQNPVAAVTSNESYLNNLRQEYNRSRCELLEEIDVISRSSTPTGGKRPSTDPRQRPYQHSSPNAYSMVHPPSTPLTNNFVDSIVANYDPINSMLSANPKVPLITSTPLKPPVGGGSIPPVNLYTNHYRKELEKSIKRSLLPSLADL